MDDSGEAGRNTVYEVVTRILSRLETLESKIDALANGSGSGASEAPICRECGQPMTRVSRSSGKPYCFDCFKRYKQSQGEWSDDYGSGNRTSAPPTTAATGAQGDIDVDDLPF